MNLEHITLTTNDIRLHTVQAGPPEGRLLILLHGFPEFWYGWRKQIQPLAEAGFRVVAPDQRGYNLSDKPQGIAAYRVETLAADVIGLLDALGRRTACLAGHDWGAAVAWETALRYPERLEKLAILNVPHPAVMAQTLLHSPRQMLKSWYIFFFQLPRLPEALLGARRFALLRQMLLASGKPNSFDPQDLQAYLNAWSQPGALTAMLNWYRAAFRSALRGSWRTPQTASWRVTTPTRMLWGVRDVALSRSMAQPSLDLCEQGELTFFENATHWVQHDEAEAVTAALIEFFSPA